MSKDFEQQLRDALRPVDPEEGFDQRVMARIAQERSRSPHQSCSSPFLAHTNGNCVASRKVSRRASS